MTPGTWTVTVEMFGFTTARKEVTIGATPSKIDFTLALRDRSQFGRGPGGGRAVDNRLKAKRKLRRSTCPPLRKQLAERGPVAPINP